MSDTPSITSESFKHHGTTVRVTMTDPAISSPYDIHLRRIVYERPSKRITSPTPGFGVYCPATFVVEGLPYRVEFTTDSPTTRIKDIAITSLRVDASDGITRERMGSIPVARLFAASLNAAGVTLMHYPPNYDGPGFIIDESKNRVEMSGARIRTDDKPEPTIARIGGRMPAGFAKGAAGVAELVGDERLREVARIIKGKTDDGRPATRVIMDRFATSERHARRLVQDARNAGHLPALDKNDGRTRKGKK